ncbi:MAG TPA: SUF system NifU family Fe-S cluster assembly protein [Burkholderiales bacterium]|nr:SUF system NifU family Fe-S cluster assembly protein [Burkholderiales bacterium]
MSERRSLYDDVVMDHIKNARNYRAIADASHVARGVNPLCGDSFSVYLRLEGEIVREAAFQCECCGISMASASIMTVLVTGRAVGEVRRLAREFAALLAQRSESSLGAGAPSEEAAAIVDLVRQSPSRLNCARLSWAALEAALDGRPQAVISSATA